MRWIALLVLCVVTIGYLFIGAAVFQAMESNNEEETKTGSRDRLRDFLENNTCVSAEHLENLIRGVIAAYDQGVIATNQTESNSNWDLWSSFFFSATVVTTIGYGHISPSTESGRIFCIFYAIIGIPLVGVFLTGLGLKLSKPMKTFKESSNHACVRALKSVVIAIIGFAILIFLPALAFHKNEDWTMFEGIYYAVITLTTIGFGDFVAAQDADSARAGYQIGVIVWIFIGLAWVAIIISDIGDFFTETVKSSESTIGRKKSAKEFDAIRSQRRTQGSDYKA